MRYGDLSSKVVPRLIVVFEGAVGILPESKKKAYDKCVKRDKWADAIDLFEINENVADRITWLMVKRDVSLSLVTWMPEAAAIFIEERMDYENIPIRGCFSATPQILTRQLAYEPDVMTVYDPDPAHILTYGSKGACLTSASQIGEGL